MHPAEPEPVSETPVSEALSTPAATSARGWTSTERALVACVALCGAVAIAQLVGLVRRI